MQTVVLEKPGQFSLIQTTPPTTPEPGQALVRVRRIGVCGTDLHAFRGRQPFFSYPRVLGHELGVEVVAAEPNVWEIRSGDRCAVEPYLNCGHCIACRRGQSNCCVSLQVFGVHVDGGMREILTLPIRKLHRSDALTLDQLALVEPLSIGAHAVARARLSAGESVLVIGAGPIGLSVIQFAELSDVHVIVMDVNEDRLNFCRQHHPGIRTMRTDGNPLPELQEITSGEMPTAVFDATGNPESMAKAFHYVAHGGRLIFVGLFQGDIGFHDPEFHRREMTLLSSRNATGEDFKRVIALLEAGRIDIAPWISHRVSMAGLIDQFPHWLNPQAGFIKGVVEL